MFLQGNFYHKGKKHKVVLTEQGLTWDSEGTPDLRRSASVSEIVSCWLCPRGSVACAQRTRGWGPPDKIECVHSKRGKGNSPSSNYSSGLSVEVSERREGRCWAPVVYVFCHAAPEVVSAWFDAIWILIDDLSERPRKLLTIINPIGGRRRGVANFEKRVEPLFRRAGIRTSVLQTEYKGHGTHLVQEAASEGLLKECDGVVAVGGDGLVSEIATGLFLLSSVQHGINPHDFGVDIPPSQIRMGIIPSGSTDATCFATHGSSDVVTAALHIIMGDKRLVDVASIHTKNQLHRIVTSLISYGYFGDLLRSSEQLRCLGPPRYFLSGMQQIFRNRSYPVKIRVRKSKDVSCAEQKNVNVNWTRNAISCNSVCSVCSHVEDLSSAVGRTDDEWEEIKGRFSVVSAAITSCSCRLTPQGVSPSAHLGDGFCDLILVKGSSRIKLLSYLYHTSVTGNADGLDHVKMIRTNEIHFSAPQESGSSFNCDGEEFESPSISIKIHRKKLELFCRGVEDPFPISTIKFKTSASF